MQDSQKLLEAEIKQHFGSEKRRAFFMARLIISLFTICSVSYSALSLVLNPKAKKASNFKRIQRFFKGFTISYKSYVQFVWSIINNHTPSSKSRFILAMDRTNWKFGNMNINVLMVAVVYKGGAIPLVWSLLPKQGNSNMHERIHLIRCLKFFLTPEQWAQIRCITLDREFDGNKWLAYLQKVDLSFVLRAKKSVMVAKGNKQVKIWQLFELNNYRALNKVRHLFGSAFFISGQRIIKSTGHIDYLIFISDIPGRKVATYYAERWGIEVLFGDLKSRGFNFEDTHVTNLKSIKKMIFFLSLAYIWAVKTGEWLVEQGIKIPVKIIKGQARKLYSIFRIGLDHLRGKFIHQLDFGHLIILLSCT